MTETYRRREIITLIGKNKIYEPHISLQNVVGFKLLKIMAPNVFRNVITGVNDTFDWEDSGATIRTATIPGGKYDHLSFATAFDTAVNAVSVADTFTTTFNVNTGYFNIATDNNITPLWVSGANTDKNVALIMGYFNDTTGNETSSTNHTSNFPSQLIPSFYILKSTALASGRKSSGGGGGTQISITTQAGPVIDSSPQNYISCLPNQVDGSVSTFVYRTNDDNNETYEYNAPRQISAIDLNIVHPYYPQLGQSDSFLSIYSTVTYEIEFICLKRFK